MKHARTRLVLATVLAVVAATLIASAARASSPTTWHVYVGSRSPSGQIEGMNFTPDDITINVGDTIHFTANSMEPHTVSFFNDSTLPTGFRLPPPAYMLARTSDSISAPGQFRSSGLMSTISFTDLGFPPSSTSWDLTFTGPGDYQYVCYFHGAIGPGGALVGMKGVVHVQASGAYPQTQGKIDAAFHKGQAQVIASGEQLRAQAREAADAHHVFIGATNATAMVMAFTREQVSVKVGHTVTFDMGMNKDPVPHTVTFGEALGLNAYGDPTNFQGGNLSSGILLAKPFGPPGSDTFNVRFTKAGKYHYFCRIHDDMGMVGTVVVTP